LQSLTAALKIGGMVLPQFSLRLVLGLVAVLAFVSLVISRGLQGSAWAMGVSGALVALVFIFGMCAVFYGVIFVVSLAFTGLARPPLRAQLASHGPRTLAAPPRDNTDLTPPAASET
jgi:hypothetical protein